MKRTPSVFDENGNVNAECQWVIDGEGHVTRLYDGIPYFIDKRKNLYRYAEFDITAIRPNGFIKTDVAKGKVRGWAPLLVDEIEDGVDIEALLKSIDNTMRGRIVQVFKYENKYHAVPHQMLRLSDIKDRSYKGIKTALSRTQYKGFVFEHEDGRSAKVKRSEVGLTAQGGAT